MCSSDLDRPNVIAILEPGRRSAQMFEFALKNVGNTSVYNVKVDVSPGDIIGLHDQLISEISIFNNVTPVLIPQMEFRTKLFLYFDLIKERGEDTAFTFTTTYKTTDGKKHEQSYHYNLDIYKDLSVFNEGSLKDVTNAMKKVTCDLKEISGKIDKNIQRQDWREKVGLKILDGKNDNESLDYFVSIWEDYRLRKGQDSFGEYKVQAICEALYDKLCFGNSPNQVELKKLFIELSRFDFSYGVVPSNRFLELGDRSAEIVREITKSKSR